MSIFVLEDSNEMLSNMRTKQEWVDLIKDYIPLKERKGVPVSAFCKERQINEQAFRTALTKYDRVAKRQLQDPLTEATKPNQPNRKQRKKQRKQDIIKSFRSQMKKTAAQGAAKANNKSTKWFKDFIGDAVRGRKVTKPEVGKIYAYAYDAKYKKELPYWDRFPLIIYLGSYTSKAGNKIMLGLNLHYIPPRARQAFLEELLPRANTDVITNKTRLKINWSMVKGMRGSNQMIKAYLPNRIKSSMKEVKPSDWINVIFLPTTQFMSKGKRFSARKVWSNVR